MRFARALRFVAALAVATAVGSAGAPPAHAAGAFRFAASTVEVWEDQTFARVFVQRTDLPVSRVSVPYRTEAGTAEPGADYAETSGTLVFDVGETQASFIVPVRDDDAPEEAEFAVLRLLDGSSTTARMEIVDDDVIVEAESTDEDAAAPTTAGAGRADAAAPPAVAASAQRPPALPRQVATRPAARRPVAATRPANGARRVSVRQTPVTPFELRPSPGGALATDVPTDVDPALAVLAALLLARVAAEVWFRTRAVAG